MKTCCLVWEIPVIEGEHYNPIMNVIYMQKAKKFLNQLNRYFQDENMCIFRKNCASVPEERSAIPLQTEQSSAG